MKKWNIASIRKDYSQKQLNENDVEKNPFIQFDRWFGETLESKVSEPNAMILATATSDGKPSARVVLLKQFDSKGFSFFTNYQSKKGEQITQNPFGSIVFFWPELERQIRIEGAIKMASEEESETYFQSRPEGSRIGAWISPQSKVIPNRDHLESLLNSIKESPKNRPPHWGGYILTPTLFEFWQGRPNRLHDRIQYTLKGNSWVIERLAP